MRGLMLMKTRRVRQGERVREREMGEVRDRVRVRGMKREKEGVWAKGR